MALKTGHFRNLNGWQIWKIIRTVRAEHDYRHFKRYFRHKDMGHRVPAARALTLALICLGNQKDIQRRYQTRIPLPLKKELERICSFTGTKTSHTGGIRNDAAVILGNEIDTLLLAYNVNIVKRPQYKGKRLICSFNITKYQTAALKILSLFFILKEWELVTLLLAGSTVYRPPTKQRKT